MQDGEGNERPAQPSKENSDDLKLLGEIHLLLAYKGASGGRMHTTLLDGRERPGKNLNGNLAEDGVSTERQLRFRWRAKALQKDSSSPERQTWFLLHYSGSNRESEKG